MQKKKKKKWAFSEAGSGNVKVIWIQRQLNEGPSGALMEPAWVPLLERVLYIFIMSQHILIPIWTLQPHVMGLDSYNPLGILLQQNMPASSSMCFILFTSMSSHKCVTSCHSLQQLSEEHRGKHHHPDFTNEDTEEQNPHFEPVNRWGFYPHGSDLLFLLLAWWEIRDGTFLGSV